jgi:hypothetical protein
LVGRFKDNEDGGEGDGGHCLVGIEKKREVLFICKAARLLIF